MTTFIQKLKPEWILRIFLGLMFVYSGYDIMIHPTSWVWAVSALPSFAANLIENSIGIETYLRLQGASELILALALLAWFLPRKVTIIAALVAAFEMLAITLLVGLDAVTFRDIGLIGAGFALFVILAQSEKVQTDEPNAAFAKSPSEPKEEGDDVVVEVFKH